MERDVRLAWRGPASDNPPEHVRLRKVAGRWRAFALATLLLLLAEMLLSDVRLLRGAQPPNGSGPAKANIVITVEEPSGAGGDLQIVQRSDNIKERRVVVLLDWSCVKRRGAYWREEACTKKLLSGRACKSTATASCWLGAVGRTYARQCRPLFHLSKCSLKGTCSSYAQGWQAILHRTLPYMSRQQGWEDFIYATDPEQISDADVIVLPAGVAAKHWRLLNELNPAAQFVLVDPSGGWGGSGQGAPLEHAASLLGHSQVALVLTAAAPPAGDAEFMQRLGNVTAEALGKVVPLLPPTLLYRYPWGCGGRPEYSAFAGFFQPGSNQVQEPPPLKQRGVDVALIPSGAGSSSSSSEAAAAAAREAAERLRKEDPRLAVVVAKEGLRENDYGAFLRLLADAKVVVSPSPAWVLADIEALIMGALLLKPALDASGQLPAVYPPLHTSELVVGCQAGLGDLPKRATSALANLAASQSMVDSARRLLRHYSTPWRVAADLSRAMEEGLQRWPAPSLEEVL